MAMGFPCQTDGAVFTTMITSTSMHVRVAFNRQIDLTAEQAEILELMAHNAMESLLAPHFKDPNKVTVDVYVPDGVTLDESARDAIQSAAANEAYEQVQVWRAENT